MAGGEALEGLALHERTADHAVARRSARAVGVELAELVGPVVFVQEEVEAAHGQQLVVAAGQKHELFHFGRQVEHGAVGGVVQVAADDLAQDAMGHAHLVADEGQVVVVDQVGHVGEGSRLAVHVDVGLAYEVERGPAARQVALQLADDVDVFPALFFHGGSLDSGLLYGLQDSTAAAPPRRWPGGAHKVPRYGRGFGGGWAGGMG